MDFVNSLKVGGNFSATTDTPSPLLKPRQQVSAQNPTHWPDKCVDGGS